MNWFQRWFGRSQRIEEKIDRLFQLEEKIMGQLEDIAIALDAETNALAAKLDSLNAQLQSAIAAGQAPSPDTIAKLQAISDRLKTLGADPTNPIPA